MHKRIFAHKRVARCCFSVRRAAHIINYGGKAMPSLKSNRVLAHPGSKTDERQFESKVGIPENNRRPLIDLLNARLADTIDLQTQAKFAHWNVKGEDFYQLHLLFDSIAEHVEEAVDLIAERVTALGGRANGTARQVAANSSINEYDLNVMHGMDHVRAADKDIYFLQSHLQGGITTFGH